MAINYSDAHPQVGVGVLLMKEGKALLGKRKGSLGEGTYGWPGGNLEFGETLEQCAIREVFEETGLIVKELEFVCVSNIIAYGKHYLDFQFRCVVREGDAIAKEPDKVESWKWYFLESLPTPLFRPAELALESLRTGRFYNP